MPPLDPVFVSYASADRGAVLPVVDHVQSLGIPLWIDRNKIPGGADYTSEIPRAIGESSAVMLFASRNAFLSRNVKKELSLAWKKARPVIPLFLEDVQVPETFEWHLEAVQMIPLFKFRDGGWAEEVLRALAPYVEISAEATSALGTRGPAPERAHRLIANPLVAYLVNRLQQEQELRTAISRHSSRGGRSPLPLVVYGHAEQALHEYLDRLERVTLPRLLKSQGYSDNICWINLQWTRGAWDRDPSKTVANACNQLEAQLALPPESWPNHIPQAVGSLRSALVVCCRLQWRQWKQGHVDVLKAWLAEWARIPPLPVRHPLIGLVAVEYSSSATWFDRMPWRPDASQVVREQMTEIATVKAGSMVVTILPELGNVTQQDIQDWILNDLRPSDPARVIRNAREILNDSDLLTEEGTTMSRIADRLRRVVDNAFATDFKARSE